ncbi:MAG: hypothetical protein KDC65_09205, partial [Saprospiraceae bacterium]|nr:hypothetical protein [Saprospiraceae bacterium]
ICTHFARLFDIGVPANIGIDKLGKNKIGLMEIPPKAGAKSTDGAHNQDVTPIRIIKNPAFLNPEKCGMAYIICFTAR